MSFRTVSLIAITLLIAPIAQADLVILQYHHVDDSTPEATSTSPALFRKQLALIEELGIEVVPLAEGVRKAMGGDYDARPKVAITFDDAYESVADRAWPLLRERGWPFTLFVNAQPLDEKRAGYMDWDTLARMRDDPAVTLGNHTYDHAHLIPRPEESREAFLRRTRESLDRGYRRLEEKLGISPDLFAYPYGEYTEVVQDMIRAREWTGFGQQSGAVGKGADPTSLPRYPAANAYGRIDSLETKLTSRAFPLDYQTLPDPVIDQNPPVLTYPLPEGWRAESLACYGSGQGQLPLSVQEGRVRVAPETPFNGRRFRYNCTYPAGQGRFFWLSMQWISADQPED